MTPQSPASSPPSIVVVKTTSPLSNDFNHNKIKNKRTTSVNVNKNKNETSLNDKTVTKQQQQRQDNRQYDRKRRDNKASQPTQIAVATKFLHRRHNDEEEEELLSSSNITTKRETINEEERTLSNRTKLIEPKKNRTLTATSTIFAPRTEEMNKGFLTFSEKEPGRTRKCHFFFKISI